VASTSASPASKSRAWTSSRRVRCPSTNESADTSVYAKYRANYSTTTGILWCPQAVGTVKLMDVALESERDARRQEDFMVAKMAAGTDAIRKECAVEFKTA
jgi:hypothetical protein